MFKSIWIIFTIQSYSKVLSVLPANYIFICRNYLEEIQIGNIFWCFTFSMKRNQKYANLCQACHIYFAKSETISNLTLPETYVSHNHWQWRCRIIFIFVTSCQIFLLLSVETRQSWWTNHIKRALMRPFYTLKQDCCLTLCLCFVFISALKVTKRYMTV